MKRTVNNSFKVGISIIKIYLYTVSLLTWCRWVWWCARTWPAWPASPPAALSGQQQSWARHNTPATTLPRQCDPVFPQKKLLINGIMCIYVVAILHLDTDVHTFFPLFLVTEAPLRCRVVVVVQLKNWRVPSSDIQYWSRVQLDGPFTVPPWKVTNVCSFFVFPPQKVNGI